MAHKACNNNVKACKNLRYRRQILQCRHRTTGIKFGYLINIFGKQVYGPIDVGMCHYTVISTTMKVCFWVIATRCLRRSWFNIRRNRMKTKRKKFLRQTS